MDGIEIYKAKDGLTKVEVKFENGTVWLSLNQISELFGRDKSVVSRHLKNVFETKELDRKSVVAKNATTANDGKRYEVDYFNLDAIISVGYRVNSKQGTQFRIWATQRLKEYLIKGYAINEQKLKASQEQFKDLKKSIQLLEKVVNNSNAMLTKEASVLCRLYSAHADSSFLGMTHSFSNLNEVSLRISCLN